MVNFADCVSKVQCRNLVTNTPTKDGIKTVLEKTVSNSKRLDSLSEAINVAVQNRAMYSMGAKQKGWVQKFYDKYGFRSGAKAEQELLRYMKSSKFEPCGIPVGTKEMFNSNIAKALEVPVDTFVKAVKN